MAAKISLTLNEQKVLGYLSGHLNDSVTTQEISLATGVPKGSVHYALVGNELAGGLQRKGYPIQRGGSGRKVFWTLERESHSPKISRVTEEIKRLEAKAASLDVELTRTRWEIEALKRVESAA